MLTCFSKNKTKQKKRFELYWSSILFEEQEGFANHYSTIDHYIFYHFLGKYEENNTR